MTNKEKEELIRKALKSQKQDLYILKSVMDINHQPHGYLIGPEHLLYAKEHHIISLNDEVFNNTKCAYPNCKLEYKEHTFNNVCFLQQLRHGSKDEANKLFKDLIEKVGDKLVDGFAFIETDEKFRIK